MKLVVKALKVILFFALAPIYIPAYIIMNFSFKWWSGLLGGD